MNYRVILHTLGWVLNIEAAAMVLPLVCSLLYGEMPMVKIFLVCIAICLSFGVILTVKPLTKKNNVCKRRFHMCGTFLDHTKYIRSITFLFFREHKLCRCTF